MNKFIAKDDGMYRKKKFLLMQVYNANGKNLGFIKDVLLDFGKGEVLGFSITSYKLFSNYLCILKNNIIAFNENMIVNGCSSKKTLALSNITNISVIDIQGNVIGVVEDIIFKQETFKIMGFVISTGYITNFIYGKRIIPPKDVIVGENTILYNGKQNDKIIFSNLPGYKLKGINNYV